MLTGVTDLIWDFDDTLIVTAKYYWQAQQNAYKHMAADGITPEEAQLVLDAVERENILKFGFARERFPLSLAGTYIRICQMRGLEPNHHLRFLCEAAGWAVYDTDHPVLNGAHAALRQAKQAGFKQHLFTKGDHELQQAKLDRSGLRDYFDVVEVVLDKNTETFNGLIQKHGLDPSTCCMIGDSPKSDINPAIAVGMRAIHIPCPDAWSYEHEDPHPSYAGVPSLMDLVALLAA